MRCSHARSETCSTIPNGPAMMRPSSARGSEAASVEDAALPARERKMSCLKVVSLDAQQLFCQEVNRRRITVSPNYKQESMEMIL